MLEKIKENLIISTIIVGAICATAGWGVCYSIWVEPLKYDITQKERKIDELSNELEKHKSSPKPSTTISTSGTTTIIKNTEPNIFITDPKDRNSVPRESKARGTFKNIPKGEELWFYIYPKIEQKYYLIPIKKQSNGNWEIEKVIIGAADDKTGDAYNLGILLADAEVSAEIQRNQQSLDNGFEKLPVGRRFSEIIVYRK